MAYDNDGGLDRRQTLKCMLWAGTGVVWTVAGGVPASRLIGSAKAAEGGFSFVQISDSHIGFSKPANPDARATLDAAIDKILAMPGNPAFMIHTGDVTHTAAAAAVRRRAADDQAGEARRPLRAGRARHPRCRDADRLSRALRQGATGGGWYSFDHGGVHFVSLVNVVDLKKNGLGSLGAEQIAWLDDDLKGKSASTPIVLFCHIPLWMVAPDWGWGTEDSAQALALVVALRLGDRAQRPHPPAHAEGRRRVTFHTARSTAFPQPAPGTAPSPGPKLVPAGELRKWLGVREVAYSMTPTALAVTDADLS